MPVSPISSLPEERQELLDNLNYLNTAEIKSFCRRHSIPYTISIETKDGRKKTKENDRKGAILNRIRHFLQTGVVLPETCFRAAVVCFDALPKEYASAWLQAVREHSRPNAEWAFLSDRARGTAGPDWKRLRAKKAAKVMKMLNQITSG